ncbi:MAG: YidC/Oxa1 family membrane protein insertase [Christensenellales bacterium]
MNAISQLFLTALEWLVTIIGDYGWSVVIFTLAFRILLIPLDYWQRKSMKKQQDIAPKVAAINAKYANDKDKANQKVMQLYKDEKVSVLSGCLPMLIQLPIFIFFFAAIRAMSENQLHAQYLQAAEAAAAGQNPASITITSFYWIKNLWQPDTFMASVIPSFSSLSKISIFANVTDYDTVMAPLMDLYANVKNGYAILPILAGTTSILSSMVMNPQKRKKKTPQEILADKPEDQSAATGKMMQYFIPVISVIFCWTSSAAFALYWVTSNLASMVNTLVINWFLKRQEQRKAELEVQSN